MVTPHFVFNCSIPRAYEFMAGYVGKALPLDNYPVTVLLYETVRSKVNNMEY